MPDLILLHIMLPKMSGPDVLKVLKKDPATAAIPVMMLTSLSQKNAKHFEKGGASFFFEKSDSMLGKNSPSNRALQNRATTTRENPERGKPSSPERLKRLADATVGGRSSLLSSRWLK